MSQPTIEQIVEAALLAAGRPLTLDRLRELFDEGRAWTSCAARWPVLPAITKAAA